MILFEKPWRIVPASTFTTQHFCPGEPYAIEDGHCCQFGILLENSGKELIFTTKKSPLLRIGLAQAQGEEIYIGKMVQSWQEENNS